MDLFDYCWEIPRFSLKSKQWGKGGLREAPSAEVAILNGATGGR